MKRTSALTVFLTLAFLNSAFAEIHDTSTEIKDKIHKALNSGKSMKDVYADLESKYGKRAIASLIEISKDQQNNDQTRWAALFGLGKISGKESLGVIKNFFTDASWMLRDAALKTAAALGAKELIPQIEQRLKDQALIVRTTAVQAIRHLHITGSSPKLVDALFDPINYNKGKPLWIQKHILGTISEFQYKPAVPKLVELLENTKDKEFQGQIVSTLEKLTGKSFSGKSLGEQVYLWKRNALAEMTF